MTDVRIGSLREIIQVGRKNVLQECIGFAGNGEAIWRGVPQAHFVAGWHLPQGLKPGLTAPVVSI